MTSRTFLPVEFCKFQAGSNQRATEEVDGSVVIIDALELLKVVYHVQDREGARNHAWSGFQVIRSASPILGVTYIDWGTWLGAFKGGNAFALEVKRKMICGCKLALLGD